MKPVNDTERGPAPIDRRTLLIGGGGALAAALALGGASPAAAGAEVAAAVESSPAPASCRQLIAVNAGNSTTTVATLNAWQRYPDGSWRRQFGPIPAHVGSLGVGQASEGSSKTPAGTFAMDVAFGRQADPGTTMPYFTTDPLDWWDCNPTSPTYNQHVRRSSSPGGNSENLYYVGALYDYAVNINHNPRRVPGAGSAIFLHVTDGGPTGGCVSIDRSALAAILRWLKPTHHPYATIRVGSSWTPLRVPLSQAENFVEELYRTVLASIPSAAAVAPWAQAVHLGADRRYIGDRFGLSTGRYDLITQRAYAAVLGRRADATWLAVRRNTLARGGKVGDLMVALAASDEAWNKAGRDWTRWVQRTCTAFIGRPSSDVSSWVAMAKRSGRSATASAITRTTSFGLYRLDQLYRQMVGRYPSASARSYYGPWMRDRGDFVLPGVIASGSLFWSRAQS